MILTFYRTIVRPNEKGTDAKVIAKLVAADGEHQTTLGVLEFPNQTLWAKFYGSVQTGALRIKDLTVVMENSKEDQAMIAKVMKPKSTTTIVGAIGSVPSGNTNTGSDSK